MLDGPDEEHPEETHAHPDGESSLPTSANSIPLRSVDAAAAYIPFITDSRKKVKEEMEAMVLQGLSSLVCSIPCVFVTDILTFLTGSVAACIFTADGLQLAHVADAGGRSRA